jgi:hypothetical protein
MKIAIINSKDFNRNGCRIDPSLHLSDGVRTRELLSHSPYKLSTVDENSDMVFLGNIFSRIFVKDPAYGMPYLAASDTVLSNIETGKFLSKKQAKSLSNLILKKDWILVTCSGTLGNVTYTNKLYENHIATHDLIRIIPNSNLVNKGTLFAFLAGKFGYNQITQSMFGGVVKHINDGQIKTAIIPVFPESFQKEVDDLIQESARLREEAAMELEQAQQKLKQYAGLRDLTVDDYDYYGPKNEKREVSCFTVNRKNINATTINAFNLSERIRKTKQQMRCKVMPLRDILVGGQTFSSTAVSSTEVKPQFGVMFINQKDIFDNIIKGKWISKNNIPTETLVKYGEVLVACDGTLGESELFCRALFAYEDLSDALISTHFIRMKTNDLVPSGYLYLWLSTDYGFRYIRNTQAGTKLCHPIPKLFLDIPVPIIDNNKMEELDQIVKTAHTKRYQANCNERMAISMVESEIEKWNKN